VKQHSKYHSLHMGLPNL